MESVVHEEEEAGQEHDASGIEDGELEKDTELVSLDSKSKKKRKKKPKKKCKTAAAGLQFPIPVPVKIVSSHTDRSCVAKQAIKAGQLLFQEQAFGFIIRSPFIPSVCSFCALPIVLDAPLSCTSCHMVSYCSASCQRKQSELHDIECELLRHVPGVAERQSTDLDLLRMVLRLTVAKTVPTVTSTTMQQPLSLSSQWSDVSQLLTHKEHFSPSWLAAVTAAVTDMMAVGSAKLSLDLEECVSLACRININAHGLVDIDGDSNTNIGLGLFPFVAMLNHSCEPNAVYICGENGVMSVRAIRDLSDGEEVSVHYVDLYQPLHQRREALLHSKHFLCQCRRCLDSIQNPSSIDRFLSALCCPLCGKRFLLQSNPQDVTVVQCQSCNWKTTQLAVDKVVDDAKLLLTQAEGKIVLRQYGAARKLLDQLMDRYEAVDEPKGISSRRYLHPDHYILFSALTPLLNCCNAEQDYLASAKCCRRIVGSMDRHFPVNHHEKGPFLISLAESLLAFVGSRSNLPRKSSHQYRQEAKDALVRACEVYGVCLGQDHKATRAVHAKLASL
eukprot:GILK01008812.1.p1 GENE.GILK01008812.1~~GILK01008812.1.p1  ORF type:complete len:570 (+),score=84.96 GILK01008812.1:38-1711(+)